MNRILLPVVFLTTSLISFSQNIGINSNGSAPDASAMLDVVSTDKGLLVPRMTTVQKAAITSPATGLIVYDNDTSSFWYFNGTIWVEVLNGKVSELIDDDADTKVQVEESADEDMIRFDVAGSEAMMIYSDGNVGIGNSAPVANLQIGNNVATGALDNFSEYQILLYQSGAGAANSYGIGIRGNTFISNSDMIFDWDIDGTTKWRMESSRLEPQNAGNSVFVGIDAGANDDLSDNRNVGIGWLALNVNTTGAGNVAVGQNTLHYSTVSNTTAIGAYALDGNTTGIENTAVGTSTLGNNSTGGYNTAVGRAANYANTTGSYNTTLGYRAGASSTTTNYNTAIGYSALDLNRSPYIVGVGAFALANNTNGTYNTSVGTNALRFNTSGFANTSVGLNSLYANTVGDNNTALGSQTLDANTTGNDNTAVGQYALTSNSTASYSTAVGTNALQNANGDWNTAVGRNTLLTTSGGVQNTGLGAQALYHNTTGNYNTSTGVNSAYENTTGSYNTSVGHSAGRTNTVGWYNTFVGYNARPTVANLTNAVAIGYSAYVSSSNTIKLGHAGTGVSIGNATSKYGNATLTLWGNGSTSGTAVLYRTDLGGAISHLQYGGTGDWYIRPSLNTGKVVLADNGARTCVATATPTTTFSVNGSAGKPGGGGWTNISDKRLKHNVSDYNEGLELLEKLHLVNYSYNEKYIEVFGANEEIENGKVFQGVIAQELQKVSPDMVTEFEAEGTTYLQVDLSKLQLTTINAVLEQQEIIESQQSEIDELRKELEELKNLIQK